MNKNNKWSLIRWDYVRAYRQRFSINMTRTLLGMEVYCYRCDINITSIDFAIYAI